MTKWTCGMRDHVTLYVGSISDIWLSVARQEEMNPNELLGYLLIHSGLSLHLEHCEDCSSNMRRLVGIRILGKEKCPDNRTVVRDAVFGELHQGVRRNEHIENCKRCKPLRDSLRRTWKDTQNLQVCDPHLPIS